MVFTHDKRRFFIVAFRAPILPRAKLRVVWMALALVLAAFLGAALGLVWQSDGFAEEEEQILTGEA